MQRITVLKPQSLIGWTPYELFLRDSQLALRWVALGEAQFDEPFFDETIRRRLSAADARTATTGVEFAQAVARVANCLSPGGLVFHMSRVGSTLFANLLKAIHGSLVISEPRPVNQMLGTPSRDMPPEAWRRSFEGLVLCLGQPRRDGDRRYFLKFSSHNLLRFPLIRGTFPEAPWLFLYRHPVEVMVSALRRPPGWLQLRDDPATAEAVLGIPRERTIRSTREEFCGEVLQRLLQAALAAMDDRGRAVDYARLSAARVAELLEHFGARPSAEDWAAIEAAFRGHAKDAATPFRPDSEEKRREAGPELWRIFERSLEAPYLELERHARSLRDAS